MELRCFVGILSKLEQCGPVTAHNWGRNRAGMKMIADGSPMTPTVTGSVG